MYTRTLKDDVQTWLFLAEQCFGFGHHITNARLHAIYKMIVWRLEGHLWGEDEFHVPVQALARLCEFAAQFDVSAGEKQIYIHMLVDGCKELLKQVEKPAGDLSVVIDKVPFYRVPYVEAAHRRETNERITIRQSVEIPPVTPEEVAEAERLLQEAYPASEPEFVTYPGDTCPSCESTNTERIDTIGEDPSIWHCQCRDCAQTFEVMIVQTEAGPNRIATMDI